jgi:hypothetical protein
LVRNGLTGQEGGHYDRVLDQTAAGRNPRGSCGRPVVLQELERPWPLYLNAFLILLARSSKNLEMPLPDDFFFASFFFAVILWGGGVVADAMLVVAAVVDVVVAAVVVVLLLFWVVGGAKVCASRVPAGLSGNGPGLNETVEVPFTTVGVAWVRPLTKACVAVCVETEDEPVVVVGVVAEGLEIADDTAGVAVADVCVVAAVDAALVDVAVLDVVEPVLDVVDDGMTDSQSTVILLPSMVALLEAETT